MRVRIMKSFASGTNRGETIGHRVGEVVNVDKKKAESWIAGGLAMEEKSLDGAKESKGGKK